MTIVYLTGSINNRMKTNQKDDLDVLVCTDDVLLDLNIRHAQHILHYSLPADWTTFTHRFGASFEYYENLVQDVSVFVSLQFF